MQLIKNLIRHKLIQPGTWLGVRVNDHTRVQHRLRVERVCEDQVWACVPHSGEVIQVPDMHICEVDGMALHRACAQADLDAFGNKLAPKTRRGRKPKYVMMHK
jgi:hypothetical protein